MKTLGLGMVVVAAFGIAAAWIAVTESSLPAPIPAGISHAQVESDLVMTQQMSYDIGPAMERSMAVNGMLARSADPAYVRALEQHVRDLDRMLARMP